MTGEVNNGNLAESGCGRNKKCSHRPKFLTNMMTAICHLRSDQYVAILISRLSVQVKYKFV